MKKNIFIVLVFFICCSNLAAISLRIDIKELKKDFDSYKIIDVRTKKQYLEGHLKKALNFPSSLTYENKKISGKITRPDIMQNLIQNLGLNKDDKIAIYDDGTFFNASRVFWSLEVYGFSHLKLINAGFNNLEEEGFSISKKELKVKKSNYIASINNKRLATKFSTQIATKNEENIIIDARSYPSYIGKKSVAKRFGHIPKAIHIAASKNIENDGFVSKLKNINELKNIYKNVNKNKKIVLYCSIGRIASLNYFALRELGYDVSNYDASWKEWGNDSSLPIINLSK